MSGETNISEDLSPYDLPLSEETREKMSLNIYDQKWIKLLFDRQDLATSKFISDIYYENVNSISKSVADVLEIRDRRMFDELHDQTEMIKEIKEKTVQIEKQILNLETRLEKEDKRIVDVERKTSFKIVLTRVIITILINVLITLFIYYFYLK